MTEHFVFSQSQFDSMVLKPYDVVFLGPGTFTPRGGTWTLPQGVSVIGLGKRTECTLRMSNPEYEPPMIQRPPRSLLLELAAALDRLEEP